MKQRNPVTMDSSVALLANVNEITAFIGIVNFFFFHVITPPLQPWTRVESRNSYISILDFCGKRK